MISPSQNPELAKELAESGRETPAGANDSSQVATGPFEPTTQDFPTEENPPAQAVAPPAGIRPGDMVGRYLILQEIGEGGMGVVFKARHLDLDRIVALKTLRPKSEQVERFIREIKISAKFEDHPHIVRVYDVGEYQGRPYFTMAYLGGGTLTGRKQELLASPDKAVALMEKVARGVQFAHEHGVWHRDLKPSNVLMDDKGEPHVTDFGLAWIQDNRELTRPNAVMGTVPYMAPEQAAGRTKHIGPATDVWQLGVMLYELLVGKRPFDVKGDRDEEILRKIQKADPKPPRAERPGLSKDLEMVVLKCLEKERADRYGMARELAEDLGRWLREEPVSGARRSFSRRIRRGFRRYFWHAAIVLTALVVMAVSAAIFYYSDPSRKLRELESQLAKGEKVTLIGQAGIPDWNTWHLNKGQVDVSPTGEGFSLASVEMSLMEVLPHPPAKGYQLDAEIHHDTTGQGGTVGVYFDHSTHRIGHKTEHSFLTLTFNDLETLERDATDTPCSRVALKIRRWNDQDNTNEQTPIQQILYPGKAGLWRTIKIKKWPARTEVFWMGQPLGEITTTDLKDSFTILRMGDLKELWRNENPGVPFPAAHKLDMEPSFSPKNGLGLCVWQGKASFKNVTVNPLE